MPIGRARREIDERVGLGLRPREVLRVRAHPGAHLGDPRERAQRAQRRRHPFNLDRAVQQPADLLDGRAVSPHEHLGAQIQTRRPAGP